MGQKREYEEAEDAPRKLMSSTGEMPKAEADQDLQYEDPFPDEYEPELQEDHQDSDGEQDAQLEDSDMQHQEVDEMQEDKIRKRVWLPQPGESKDMDLDYDSRAYKCYHKLKLEWPCLSFDIIHDPQGGVNLKFPLKSYLVTGTQAEGALKNKISVMKVSDLHKTKYDQEASDDEDEDSSAESDNDSDMDLDTDPIVEEQSFRHEGCVNRVRCAPQVPHIVATWSDTGKVRVWDVKPFLEALDHPPRVPLPGFADYKPVFTFKGHKSEGYALDWSLTSPGRLLSGDCKRAIHLWEPRESSWDVDRTPFKGHEDSVEDLQWSPNQADVFASCSVDKSIRIWDARKRNGSALVLEGAHESDVNTISWNRLVANLLVSGSDDASFKIWDLRYFKEGSAAGHFRWHTAPITSVEWHPVQESVLAVSSEDDSVSIWDMSLEADDSGTISAEDAAIPVPPQLMFIHRGQKDVKEVHFHKQIPGLLMSTAEDGLDVFLPDNL